MDELMKFPKHCRTNLSLLMHFIPSSAETVYSMMKMTANSMDLEIDSNLVVYSILSDCGIEAYG